MVMRHVNMHPRSRGFSIVELMIALALGVVITAGIVQLFVANDRTYTLLNGQARLQESARYAFEFIKENARSSGFLGCGPEQENIVKGLRGSWPMLYEFDVTTAIAGYDGRPDGSWAPSLAALPRTESGITTNAYVAGTGVDTTAIVPGTDVVAFRRVRAPERRLMQTLQPLGDPVVAAPGGDPGFGVGDIVVVSDCEQAAVFRVTGLAVAGNQATVLHATSAAGDPYENATIIESPTGPVPATLSIVGRSYTVEATIGAVETTIFFIAPGAGTNNRGAVPLSLWQRAGTNPPVELVAGVEDLQVLYGIDTTLEDGAPNINRYVTFDQVPDPNQIVSLRVTLTVSSVDAVDEGNLLRRTMSETIVLRNARPSV